MSNIIFAFATIVVDKWGHLPHFYEIVKSIPMSNKFFSQILNPGPSLFKLFGGLQD